MLLLLLPSSSFPSLPTPHTPPSSSFPSLPTFSPCTNGFGRAPLFSNSHLLQQQAPPACLHFKDECSSSVGFLHASWLCPFFTWANDFETRRVFLMRSLHRRGNQIFLQLCKPTTFQVVTPGQGEPENLWTRRVALIIPLLVVGSPSVTSLAAVTPAERNDFANSLLRNLGIGDPDIYYPRIFEGIWDCSSTLVAVDTPQVLQSLQPG